jgi:hypothetical protein
MIRYLKYIVLSDIHLPSWPFNFYDHSFTVVEVFGFIYFLQKFTYNLRT